MLLSAAAVLLAGLGCVGPWTPTPVPMPVERLVPMPAGSPCLLVLLPGRGDRAGVFRREGFGEAALAAGLRADVVATDLHLGYYLRRQVHERLHDDVIAPARARGVREIWLVGVSMGGLGALVYDRFHPGEAAGIVLLAPYLGEDEVIDEIAVAGGLAHWRPATVAADDWQRDTWVWLRRWLEPAASTPRIVLGWGLQDRLGRSNRLLADVLTPSQVFTTAGKHDWPVWRALWRSMLESGQVAPDCR